jgi:hypothetical protein
LLNINLIIVNRARQELENDSDPVFDSSQMTTSTPSDKSDESRTGTRPKVQPVRMEDVGEDEGEDQAVGGQRYVDMSLDSVGVFSPIRGINVTRTIGSNHGSMVQGRSRSLETMQANDGATVKRSTSDVSGPSVQSEYYTAVSANIQYEDEGREGRRSTLPEARRSPRLSGRGQKENRK